MIAYVWANAVPCPRTGRLVPLLTDKGSFVRQQARRPLSGWLLHRRNRTQRATLRVVLGREVDKADASTGTMARGKAVSPYDTTQDDGEYIKEAAQSGGMSQLLYAIAVRKPSGERTWAPNEADLEALRAATGIQGEGRGSLRGIPSTEEFPEGNDLRPKHYGLNRWVDLPWPSAHTERLARVREARARGCARFPAKRPTRSLRVYTDAGKAPTTIRTCLWHVSKQVMRSV